MPLLAYAGFVVDTSATIARFLNGREMDGEVQACAGAYFRRPLPTAGFNAVMGDRAKALRPYCAPRIWRPFDNARRKTMGPGAGYRFRTNGPREQYVEP